MKLRCIFLRHDNAATNSATLMKKGYMPHCERLSFWIRLTSEVCFTTSDLPYHFCLQGQSNLRFRKCIYQCMLLLYGNLNMETLERKMWQRDKKCSWYSSVIFQLKITIKNMEIIKSKSFSKIPLLG